MHSYFECNFFFFFLTDITNIATKSAPTQDRQICTSEDCLRSGKLVISDYTVNRSVSRYSTDSVFCSKATSFIESMNTSVNPCEDFYQFACGKYPVYHSIPKTSMSNDRFDEVHSRMLVHIRGTILFGFEFHLSFL